MEKKFVTIQLHDFGDYMGEQFLVTDEAAFNEALFSASELSAMKAVIEYFKKITVNGIVNKSHEEIAWINNVADFKTINYNYGFELKYPDLIN